MIKTANLTAKDLVPTRVGMILTHAQTVYIIQACPHTRGDDP